MVDLATFADNPDSERFEKSMQSTRTAGVLSLALSNRGIPKYRLVQQGSTGDFGYSSNNNVAAKLHNTFGGSLPALSFEGRWRSNSAHVLVHYDFDNVPETD